MATSRLLLKQTRHDWTDWAGFVFFLSMAVLLFRRSMTAGFMLFPIFLHEGIVAFSFLLRRPARRELPGWRPRIAAYAGTFFVLSFAIAAATLYPGWLRPSSNKLLIAMGYLLWLFGVLFSVWTTWRLRSSFSLIPQAREIVTSGPYRIARHPIYTAYIVQYLGFWLAFRSPALTFVLLAWFGLTVVRIRYEELVLSQAFPEYADYQSRVGMFGPKLSLLRKSSALPKIDQSMPQPSSANGPETDVGAAGVGPMWLTNR